MFLFQTKIDSTEESACLGSRRPIQARYEGVGEFELALFEFFAGDRGVPGNRSPFPSDQGQYRRRRSAEAVIHSAGPAAWVWCFGQKHSSTRSYSLHPPENVVK